jgi:uncharacterized protein involved in exopolysaccharide biosynthesis
MTAPIKIIPKDATPLARHREQVAAQTLRALWREKVLIIALMAVSLIAAAIALVFIQPSYSAETVIQFDFGDDAKETSEAARNPPVASIDAAVLVEGGARLIGSRRTVGAVVDRLHLDTDSKFLRKPILLESLAAIRTTFGLERSPELSNRELAIDEVLRHVAVKSQPRSYLISIVATDNSPTRAAALANAVAAEYIRGQVELRLTKARAAAEAEMNRVSSTYGEEHPTFVRAQALLKQLQAEEADLRSSATADNDYSALIGQSLIKADINNVPSFPNIRVTLAFAALGGAIVGGWWALRRHQVLDKSQPRAPR